MDIISFILSDLFYIISFILYLSGTAEKGHYFLIAGLFLHTLSIAFRWLHIRQPPFFSLYEILIFFSWTIVFISLITGLYRFDGKLVALSSIVILGIVCLLNPGINVLQKEFRTVLFPVHVLFCVLAYGTFFISFISAVLYLIRNKIDYNLIFSSAILLGLSFFTLGIILGSFWAKKAWGSYWSWDPKETAALITWIIYAVWIFTWLILSYDRKILAWLSIVSFPAVLFTWFGINFLLKGHHSYK